MCGIVGYIGRKHSAMDVLIDGLRRLEYRGYDSAGVAILDPGVARDHGAGGLALVALEPSLSWTLAVITPQRRAPSQATKALLAEIAAYFA